MDAKEAAAYLESREWRFAMGNTPAPGDESYFAEHGRKFSEALAMALDALALMEKRENGLVVELPCQVGDTVYYVGKRCTYMSDCPRQEWYEVFGDFGERCPDIGSDECDNCGVHEVMFSFSNMGSILGQVGKTVFLTRADAENAMQQE